MFYRLEMWVLSPPRLVSIILLCCAISYAAHTVAFPLGHYVENIGNETLHFLEIFNSGKPVDHNTL